MQLHVIDKQEPAKKFVGRKGEATIDKREESTRKPMSGRGMTLSLGILISAALGSSPAFLSLLRSP
jgi:hypothetical protein